MGFRQQKESVITDIQNFDTHERWQDAIQCREQLAEMAPSRLKRFAILMEIAEIYHYKLCDQATAITSYKRALELRESRRALSRLLEIALDTHDFISAIKLLERLGKLERDEKRRAEFMYTIGALYRDELHNPVRAAEHFNMALDVNALDEKPFEALVRMCHAEGDWKALELNYRRMIQRHLLHQSGANGLLAKRFSKLGEVYLERLNDPKSAVAALQTALRMDPKNQPLRMVLNRANTALTTPIPTMVLATDPNETAPHRMDATPATWFFHKDGQKQGPFSTEAVVALYGVGHIDDRTYVWTGEMPDWRRLEQMYTLYRKCKKGNLG